LSVRPPPIVLRSSLPLFLLRDGFSLSPSPLAFLLLRRFVLEGRASFLDLEVRNDVSLKDLVASTMKMETAACCSTSGTVELEMACRVTMGRLDHYNK
jgi:hypothetical protein